MKVYSPFPLWKMPKGEKPKHVTPTHTYKKNAQRDKRQERQTTTSPGGTACLKLIAHRNAHLTQFFLFFFLFFASASMLEPTLEWLVALVMLLTLSEECCLLMRRSGCWFCCCWLPLLPAEERRSGAGNVFIIHSSEICLSLNVNQSVLSAFWLWNLIKLLLKKTKRLWDPFCMICPMIVLPHRAVLQDFHTRISFVEKC